MAKKTMWTVVLAASALQFAYGDAAGGEAAVGMAREAMNAGETVRVQREGEAVLRSRRTIRL